MTRKTRVTAPAPVLSQDKDPSFTPFRGYNELGLGPGDTCAFQDSFDGVWRKAELLFTGPSGRPTVIIVRLDEACGLVTLSTQWDRFAPVERLQQLQKIDPASSREEEEEEPKRSAAEQAIWEVMIGNSARQLYAAP